MTNIVFASNSISHFPNAISGTDTDRYDSGRVRYSIDIEKNEVLNSPVFNSVSGEDTWFHFNLYFTESTENEERLLIKAFDENNKELFSVVKTLATLTNLKARLNRANGGTSANSTVDVVRNKMNTIDIHLKQNVSEHELKLYVNRFLSLTLTISSPDATRGKPVKFQLGHAFGKVVFDGEEIITNSKQSVSEIIIADEDTRNARLNILLPIGAGTDTSWEGDADNISDDDTTTGIFAIQGNLRQSFYTSNYTITPSHSISNISIVTTTTRGPNSPTKLKHFLKIGGVNYDSDEIELGFPLQYNLTDWNEHPGNSRGWLSTDLNNIQTGILSVT